MNPHLKFHFNPIETWFGTITKQAIRHGTSTGSATTTLGDNDAK